MNLLSFQIKNDVEEYNEKMKHQKNIFWIFMTGLLKSIFSKHRSCLYIEKQVNIAILLKYLTKFYFKFLKGTRLNRMSYCIIIQLMNL